jgi:hypothetical protein
MKARRIKLDVRHEAHAEALFSVPFVLFAVMLWCAGKDTP